MDDDHLEASLRDEELQVLESIYPDYLYTTDSNSLRLEIPVELGTARSVRLECIDKPGSSSLPPISLRLAYLPPILLSLTLPPGYPLHIPPVIRSIYASQSWLPSTDRLAQLLVEMWMKGEGTLYRWVEFIRNGDLLDELGLTDNTGTIGLTCPSPQILAALLLSHDAKSSSEVFAQTSFACQICLVDLKGASCVQLACSHVFCRPCLQHFWSLCIKEGDVARVGCPDPECVKKASEVNEDDLRRVVSDEEVKRWKWLRVKRAVEKDPTIVHCPVPMCQAAVPAPLMDRSEESAWTRLRTCQECGYSFCSFCRHTWHGTVNPCPRSATAELLEKYLSVPEESPERVVLERRFGKTYILKLLKDREEQEQTKKWLEESTTDCPGCNVSVEKSLGCNHMTCTKCGQHFCYRCGAKLDSSNPYTHFSVRGKSCYGKLFEFHGVDDEWQHIDGFGDL